MPRSYHNPGVFFRRMKKKPALQAILDNIMSYTEDQLANIQGQPLWIREQLVAMHRNGGQYALTPEEIADLMTATTQALSVPDPVYDAYVITKDTWADRGRGTMATELPSGSLILVKDATTITFGYSDLTVDAAAMQNVMTNSARAPALTRNQYRAAYQSIINTKPV